MRSTVHGDLAETIEQVLVIGATLSEVERRKNVFEDSVQRTSSWSAAGHILMSVQVRSVRSGSSQREAKFTDPSALHIQNFVQAILLGFKLKNSSRGPTPHSEPANGFRYKSRIMAQRVEYWQN